MTDSLESVILRQVLRYREIRPSPALGAFVSTFWLLELDGSDATPQRIVPDGRSELILNWAKPLEALQNGRWLPQPGCFFAGQIDSPLLLRPNGPAKILGMRFHPQGAAALLRPPMHELSGRFTPVDDLSVQLARYLSRALESREPIPPVESALGAALSSSRAQDALIGAAVGRIGASRGGLDIARLARDFGLSTRQFERRFQATVGLPPKLFAQMQRFNRVFPLIEDPSRNWVDAALECGYYDQAHLIRDCKRFSGTTPERLLAEDGDLARHFYQRYGMSHSSNTARSQSA